MDAVIFLKLNCRSQCKCDADSYNIDFSELGILMGPCAFRWLKLSQNTFSTHWKTYLYSVLLGHVTFTWCIIYILNAFMFYFLSLQQIKNTLALTHGKCFNKCWHQYCRTVLCYEIAARLSESTSTKAFRLLWK